MKPLCRIMNSALPALSCLLLVAFAASLGPVRAANAANDFVVYSVYRPLDLGNGEIPLKDYYVNMGTTNGLRSGATLDVYRRMSTYDLANEKLYKDITFKIATLKVIHVEENAAVARLDKLIPAEKTPALSHRYVMIGDRIQIGNSSQ